MWQDAAKGLLYASTSYMINIDGEVWLRDRDNKAHSDLNYVGHETININLPFTRSRKSEDVEIVEAET